MRAQSLIIPCRGLYTNPNDVSLPPGALLVADELDFSRPGLASVRRGFDVFGSTLSGAVNRLVVYAGQVLAHYASDKIARGTGGAWTDYQGTFAFPEASVVKPRFVEANGSLFTNVASGLKKLDSATGDWREAGQLQALDMSGDIDRDGVSGFLEADSQVAYRALWGYRDANGKLELSAPSGRLVVSNPAPVVVAAGALVLATNVVTATVASHPYQVNDVVDLITTEGTAFVAGQKTITAVTSTTFSYAFTHADTTSAAEHTFQFSSRDTAIAVPIPTHSAKATAGNLTRSGSTVTATTTTGHAYVSGQMVFLCGGETNFPSGWKKIASTPSGTSFTYAEAGSATSSTQIQVFSSHITPNHFVQLYRSAPSADANEDPSDEVGLVYEYVPTNEEIFAKSLTITDVAPDAMRGEPGYFTASQEGLLQSNYRAPFAKQVAAFRGCMFALNTRERASIQLQLLSVTEIDSSDALYVFDSNFADGVSVNAAASESGTSFQLFTDGTPAQNVDRTARSIVRTINRVYNGSTKFYASYLSGPDDAPGLFRVESRDITTTQFYVFVDKGNIGSHFQPALPERYAVTPASTSRAANVVTVTLTTDHGFVVGQKVSLVHNGGPDANFPAGTKTVASTPTSTTFTYAETGSNATLGNNAFIWNGPGVTGNVSTLVPVDTGGAANGLAWSKKDVPEAWPITNRTRLGSQTAEGLKLVATRDALYIFKADGCWRLTGEDPSTFRIDPFDPTLKCVAPETAVPFQNKVTLLSDQGFVEVGDSVRVLSLPIETTVLDTFASLTNLKKYAFAVPYESDRKYLPWLITSTSDTYATQALPYFSASDAWARWGVQATCGMVHPTEDKLYLGRNDGVVWVERKYGTAPADFVDPSSASIPAIIEWAPIYAGNPGAKKHFAEVALLFKRAVFSSGATIQFASDVSRTLSTAVSVTPPGGSAITEGTQKRLWVPQSKQRGTRLRVRFALNANLSYFRMQGLAVTFRMLGEKVGR